MTYIIKTVKKLQKIHNAKSDCWLYDFMYKHAGAIITNPRFEENDGVKAIFYKDLYWHPKTFHRATLKDLKDVVYISKEDLKKFKA